jgi:CDP-paratose 2-epimerase
VRRTRPVVVTGGAGFIGCNLAHRLAQEGEHVLVLDTLVRPGVEENLAWLRRAHPALISSAAVDVRDPGAAEAVLDSSGIFHLAAQVAVTASLDSPAADLDVNVRGTLNLLSAARRRREPAPFLFASTNKVYGDLSDLALERTPEALRPRDHAVRRYGIGEARPLCFHTPYGCSKGAADQYVLDHARTFGLPNAVLRMSCVYGPRQFGNEDQGWVAHFLISALEERPITVYGDGHQVRDILYVDDAVDAYVRAFRRIGEVRGRAFNLGGGPDNAVSLRQVLARIEQTLGRRLEVSFTDWRPADQRYFVSDTRRIRAALELGEPRPWREGLALLAKWLAESREPRLKLRRIMAELSS